MSTTPSRELVSTATENNSEATEQLLRRAHVEKPVIPKIENVVHLFAKADNMKQAAAPDTSDNGTFERVLEGDDEPKKGFFTRMSDTVMRAVTAHAFYGAAFLFTWLGTIAALKGGSFVAGISALSGGAITVGMATGLVGPLLVLAGSYAFWRFMVGMAKVNMPHITHIRKSVAHGIKEKLPEVKSELTKTRRTGRKHA